MLSILSLLHGPMLGIIGHLGTELLGSLRDKAKYKNITDAEDIKAIEQIRLASYKYADTLHIIITCALLISTIFSCVYNGSNDDLSKQLINWTGTAVFWLFGKTAIRIR